MLGLFGLLIPLLVIGGIVAIVVVSINRSRLRGEDSGEPLSPKYIFLFLLSTATLYISAVGLLILIWGLAEYWFPDPYAGFDYSSDSGAVRGGISMAIVAFPIFLYLALLTRRKVRAGEIQAGSTIRTGFIYFNLFIVTVTVMITLMVVVGAFLGGDLTPRFLVRSGGVLGTVGLVYLYYRSELEASGTTSINAAKPEVTQ